MDVIQDSSSHALKNVLALAKAIGFTRSGVLQVDYRVETELDLFIEQYVVASFVKIIIESFDVLVNKLDFPAVPTLMELYASEEMGTVLLKAAREGITNVFQNNASPTCQYGISSNYNDSLSGDSKENITRIIKEMIAIKRPGTGLPTSYLGKIVGLKLKRDIKKDSLIKLTELKCLGGLFITLLIQIYVLISPYKHSVTLLLIFCVLP